MFASTMRAKLEALAARDPRPAFLVVLLEIWKPGETRPDLLPDPAEAVKALASAGAAPRPVQVRAMIETIEGIYRHDKLASVVAAKDNLRAHLPVYERIAAIAGLDSRTETEIRHHHAKALKNVGRDAEAQAMLEEVLEGPHPLPASRLQLVRLYGRAKDTIDRAAEQADIHSCSPDVSTSDGANGEKRT